MKNNSDWVIPHEYLDSPTISQLTVEDESAGNYVYPAIANELNINGIISFPENDKKRTQRMTIDHVKDLVAAYKAVVGGRFRIGYYRYDEEEEEITVPVLHIHTRRDKWLGSNPREILAVVTTGPASSELQRLKLTIRDEVITKIVVILEQGTNSPFTIETDKTIELDYEEAPFRR